MPMTLTIPKLEMSMIEGTIAEWVAADGSAVTEGQVIYVLETDKTARDIEAPISGHWSTRRRRARPMRSASR